MELIHSNVNGSNNYKDTTINNIVVQAPKNTNVGVIELKQ